MKKILALLLALVLCVVQTPVAPQAVSPETAAQPQNVDTGVPTGATIYDENYRTELTLKIGQRVPLWVDLEPQGAVSGIDWHSSNPSVVTVDGAGCVTVLNSGSAIIYATTYNGIQDEFPISVPEALPELVYERMADGTGYQIVGADSGIYTAHIPATYQGLPVVAIRPGAFMNCKNLRYFTVDQNQNTFYVQDGVLFTDIPEKTLVCFPPAYDAENCYYVPQGTVAVAPYAFAGVRTLWTLTLQEGLRKVGDYAFSDMAGSPGYYGTLQMYMPASLTEIGTSILYNCTRGAAIYAPGDSAIASYSYANQIPFGYVSDFQGDPTNVKLGAPSVITGNALIPFNGDILTYNVSYTNNYYNYKDWNIEARVDISEYQKIHSGEVRVVLRQYWDLIAPDPYGETTLAHQPQSGLYGAGYTEGEAILRAYDRAGNLIAMQHISGDFAFSFPGAYDLGVEGGANTSLTVIPVEPVFVASGGTYNLSSLQWHQDVEGEYFRYFVIQLPDPNFTIQFSIERNLLSNSWINVKTTDDGYVVMRLRLIDKFREEMMKVVSLVFDAMICIYEDAHVKCMISSQITPAEQFGPRASALAQRVKAAMLGTYLPADLSVNTITIDSSASWTPTASQGNISLTQWDIENFSTETITHEMVHAVDQNMPFRDLMPSAWLEGRAEYIGSIICGGTGIPEPYDWSLLTETDKADFFYYYCYGVGRQTVYPIGHWFFYYLMKTYGTGASVAIAENIRNLPGYGPNGEANCLLFKDCVEQATEKGVFQHFVCEVINENGHTPVAVPAVAPTCTENGWTEGIGCSFCGKTLQGQQVVEATGHSYDENDVCTACGQTRVEHHHTVELIIAPTTEAEGRLYLTCNVTDCSQIGDITLPVLNTTDYAYEVICQPTVQAEGLARYTWKNTDYGTFFFDVPLEKLSPEIIISSAAALTGDTLTLEMRLVNNPGVAGLVLTLDYDTSVFELLTVTNGTLIAELDHGLNLSWNMDGNCTDDGVLCTLTFRIAENAPAGSYSISAKFREACNYELEDVVFTVTAGQVEVRDFVYGDADGNGLVNGKDVIKLRKYMANLDYDTGISTETVSAGADANGDGKINGQDVILLRKYMANLDYETGESTILLGPQ